MKQLSIVPALLYGKPVEIFVDLEDEEKADIKTLKRVLSARVGLTSDPLASARRFNDQKQQPGEKMSNYATELKALQSSIPWGRRTLDRFSPAIFDGPAGPH